jgi:hypothetical protein
MSSKVLDLTIALVSTAWSTAAPDAAARELRFKSKCSGSAMSGAGNINRDIIPAGMGFLACKSTLGRSTSQGVGEAMLAGNMTCPNGNPGFRMTLIPGTGHAFARDDKTGDLLFSEITSETVCYDPGTRMHFKSGTTRFTGGTGRYEGASGEASFEGTQWVLYNDAEGTLVLDGE